VRGAIGPLGDFIRRKSNVGGFPQGKPLFKGVSHVAVAMEIKETCLLKVGNLRHRRPGCGQHIYGIGEHMLVGPAHVPHPLVNCNQLPAQVVCQSAHQSI
jgi:hypothetical protein